MFAETENPLNQWFIWNYCVSFLNSVSFLNNFKINSLPKWGKDIQSWLVRFVTLVIGREGKDRNCFVKINNIIEG